MSRKVSIALQKNLQETYSSQETRQDPGWKRGFNWVPKSEKKSEKQTIA